MAWKITSTTTKRISVCCRPAVAAVSDIAVYSVAQMGATVAVAVALIA